MVTEFIIGMTCGIISGFLDLMPSFTIDMSSLAAAGEAIGRAGALEAYFPVTTLFICFALVLGLKLWMLGYRLVLFVYHQFWGSA